MLIQNRDRSTNPSFASFYGESGLIQHKFIGMKQRQRTDLVFNSNPSSTNSSLPRRISMSGPETGLDFLLVGVAERFRPIATNRGIGQSLRFPDVSLPHATSGLGGGVWCAAIRETPPPFHVLRCEKKHRGLTLNARGHIHDIHVLPFFWAMRCVRAR